MTNSSDKNVDEAKQKKREQLKAKRFREDIPNMILLIILYGFQGLPMGLFLKTIPLLFK